jgi:hypothetical protein
MRASAPWMAAPALSGGTPQDQVYRRSLTFRGFMIDMWTTGAVVDSRG